MSNDDDDDDDDNVCDNEAQDEDVKFIDNNIKMIIIMMDNNLCW